MSFTIQRCVSGFWVRNDWPAILSLGRGYNWVDFTLIYVYTEYDKFTCLYEVHLALLGLHVGFYLRIGRSEQNDELLRRKRMVEAGLMETVPLAEIDGVQIKAAAPLAREIGLEEDKG